MGKKKKNNNRTVNVFNGISFVRACACVGAYARVCVCYHYKKPCKMDDNTRTHATEHGGRGRENSRRRPTAATSVRQCPLPAVPFAAVPGLVVVVMVV